jgi:hypothetical protein
VLCVEAIGAGQIADRERDIFAFIQAVIERKQPFVIPSAQNRRVGEITGKCADEFSGAVNKQAGRDSLAQGVYLKEDNRENSLAVTN